jgi:hypothetical protein
MGYRAHLFVLISYYYIVKIYILRHTYPTKCCKCQLMSFGAVIIRVMHQAVVVHFINDVGKCNLVSLESCSNCCQESESNSNVMVAWDSGFWIDVLKNWR